MDFRCCHIRGLLLCLLLLLVTAGFCSAHAAKRFSDRELQPVLEALEEEGLPRGYLKKVFFDPRLRRINRVIGLNAMNAEAKRDYSEFATPYALRMARRFSRRYRTLLAKVERAYGVPKNALVALLLLETQFGKARMRYSVLEVYTTLVVDSAPEAVHRYYKRLKPKYPDLDKDYLEQRMERKGEWAFRELTALVSIGLEQGWDLHALKGSYAGAFGIPQFLPSSYQTWAVDGNQDRKIDLYDMADALYSVAAYLKEHGWSEDAGIDEMREAVWQYNNSSDYVDAIFAIFNALSKAPAKPSGKRKPAAAPNPPPPPGASEPESDSD